MDVKKAEELISTFGAARSIALQGIGVVGQGMFGPGDPKQQYVVNVDLKLGNITINRCHITTTQAVSRIGRELLNYGTMTIDYPGSRYYFESYPSKRKFIRNPDFGFRPIIEEGKVTAGVVWEKTLAQELGLTSGCEIVSINGKSFEGLSSCEIDDILIREFVKRKMRIEFRKNGSVLAATLYKLK
jgi:hypothetical protein